MDTQSKNKDNPTGIFESVINAKDSEAFHEFKKTLPKRYADNIDTLKVVPSEALKKLSLFDLLNMITRISYIDITAIINAHRDDGYVLAPNGRIFSPDLWMELVGEMKPYIRERIYDTNPPSHQAFADEYARQYREAFGEEWEPYRVNK